MPSNYAANIADLTAHAQNPTDAIPIGLLSTVLDKEPANVIECERGKAVGMGDGASFLCENERARAIINIIRLKYKTYQWRFYQKTPKGWKRV